MKKLITISILGASLFYNCLAHANVEVKTAHELAIFRLGIFIQLLP